MPAIRSLLQSRRFVAACLALLLLCPSATRAEPDDAAAVQRPGQIPLDAIFMDDTGRTAPLLAWFRRPVLLHLGRFGSLPTCGMDRAAVFDAVRAGNLASGADLTLLFLSTDAMDGAAEARAAHDADLAHGDLPPGAMPPHYLTGAAGEILSVANAAHFPLGPALVEGGLRQPAGVLLLTGDGRISAIDPTPVALHAATLQAASGAVVQGAALDGWACNRIPASVSAASAQTAWWRWLSLLSLAGAVAAAAITAGLLLRRRRVLPVFDA